MDEKEEKIIEEIKEYVKERTKDLEGSHDWWHTYRVWQNSKTLAKEKENINDFIVETTSLLHELGDRKIEGNEENNTREVNKILNEKNIQENKKEKIIGIIERMSFSENIEKEQELSEEGKIVQDSDRLDAIGAIGIARTFTYGGNNKQQIYNPSIKPKEPDTAEEYKNKKQPTINHFYEKLLKLKDKMNTEKAKRIAEERHDFMKKYLNQFFREWNITNKESEQ